MVGTFWAGTSHFGKVTCFTPPGHAAVPVEFAFSLSAGREWFVGEEFTYTAESLDASVKVPDIELKLTETISVAPVSFAPEMWPATGGGLLVILLEASYKGKAGDTASTALSLLTANDIERLQLRCMFGHVATHAILDPAHQAVRCIIPPKHVNFTNTVPLELVARTLLGVGIQRMSAGGDFVYGTSSPVPSNPSRPPPVPLDFGHAEQVVSVVGGTLVRVRGVNLKSHKVYYVRIGTARGLGIYDFTQDMILVRTPALPGPGVYYMEISLTAEKEDDWVSVPGRLIAPPLVRLTMKEAPAEEMDGPAVGVDIFYAPLLFVAGDSGNRTVESISVTYRVNNNHHKGPAEKKGELMRFPKDDENKAPLGPFLWFLRLSFLKPPGPTKSDHPSDPSRTVLPEGIDVGDGNADDLQPTPDLMVLITSFQVGKFPVQ